MNKLLISTLLLFSIGLSFGETFDDYVNLCDESKYSVWKTQTGFFDSNATNYIKPYITDPNKYHLIHREQIFSYQVPDSEDYLPPEFKYYEIIATKEDEDHIRIEDKLFTFEKNKGGLLSLIEYDEYGFPYDNLLVFTGCLNIIPPA